MRLKLNSCWIIFLGIFGFFWILNALLPMQSDDFPHFFSAQNGLISAKNSYLNWNGRFGELFFTAFLADLPQGIFDILNAFVGAGFIFSFFILVFGRLPKARDGFILASIFLILFHCYGFGVFAWGNGALNYLWGIFFIFLFLLPFRFYYFNLIRNNISWGGQSSCLKNACRAESFFLRFAFALNKIYFLPLFLIFAFICGDCSEQIGLLTIIFLFLLFIFCIVKYRDFRRAIPLWAGLGLIFFIGGWLFLFFSPGHAIRAQIFLECGAYMPLGEFLRLDLSDKLIRIYGAINGFKSSAFAVFSIILYFYIARFFKLKNIIKIPLHIFIIALILVLNNNFWFANIAFVGLSLIILARKDWLFRIIFGLFVAYFLVALMTIQIGLPLRARLGDVMILTAMIILLLNRFENEMFRKIIIVLCLAYGAFVLFAFVEYRILNQKLMDEIKKAKHSGNLELCVSDIYFKSFYKNLVNWSQPTADTSTFPNNSMAKYFGLKSFAVYPCQIK